MHIDNLYFEVTRRCNMKCGHCLRGCAQKVDLTIDIVDRFLRLNEVTSAEKMGYTVTRWSKPATRISHGSAQIADMCTGQATKTV